MSINQRQFEQLTEMGISLWQQRISNNDNEKAPAHQSYSDIDLNTLAKQQLFTDILLSLGLSIGEVSQQDDHINLGLFNWYFTALPSPTTIQLRQQQLITPSIDDLATSPVLKRQLWQLLSKKI